MRVADTEWNRLAGALAEHGLRRTSRRRAIVEAALAAEGYFDADMLFAMTRKIDPHVSRATIYRMLPVLCEFGWLHQTDFGEGHYRYRRHEPGQQPTVEIFIVDCGGIIDQPAPFLDEYERTLARQRGLELVGARFQLFARCMHKMEGHSCAECPKGFKGHRRQTGTFLNRKLD